MYSQNEEEKYILEAVGDRTDGTVLDIGAYDGKTRSNSLALIERGWAGYLVEPSPGPFRLLLELHNVNPKVTCLNCFLGAAVSPLVQVWVSDDGLTTTDPFHVQKWEEAGAVFYRAIMAMIPPNVLFAWFPLAQEADVVSIDTEGSSVELFLMLQRWMSPLVWCVEAVTKEERETVRTLPGYACIYESNENVVIRKA